VNGVPFFCEGIFFWVVFRQMLGWGGICLLLVDEWMDGWMDHLHVKNEILVVHFSVFFLKVTLV